MIINGRCLHDDPLPLLDLGMSNFDHSIDEGLVEALATGRYMANYAGWDFHAYVYLAGEGIYIADVHRYHSHSGYATADTLKELMIEVSKNWGWK